MSLKKNIIVDTGFYVALFNQKDSYHVKAIELEDKLGDEYQFFSTVFVVQEICWHLSNVNQQMLIEFLGSIKMNDIIIPQLPSTWIEKSIRILKKYSDHKLDLADISIVVLADYLNCGEIITVDQKDFSMLKWDDGKKYFKNLFWDSN